MDSFQVVPESTPEYTGKQQAVSRIFRILDAEKMSLCGFLMLAYSSEDTFVKQKADLVERNDGPAKLYGKHVVQMHKIDALKPKKLITILLPTMKVDQSPTVGNIEAIERVSTRILKLGKL
ncbi:hypothetical protein BX616_008968 [Lobosporangium transversale]|nr:hypothetical protein BX616_008968 [Lobosporangium transversale]